MVNRKRKVRSLTLSSSVIAKAQEAIDWYPDEYASRSGFFEIAGVRLHKALKRRKEREEK